MRFLYTTFIILYGLVIKLASLFNVKAKLWVKGRKNGLLKISDDLKKISVQQPVVWIHCASLGEFEQGRPLIEKIKRERPATFILLTFFSPSGYEIRKNYSYADYICYLPIDTSGYANAFISAINPSIAIFVKYEFWFNFLSELKKQSVPTYLISGIFRREHYFFKWYGGWFKRQLNVFTHFFVQDQVSEELLKANNYLNCTTAGDTRFDRVFEVTQNAKSIAVAQQFCNGKQTLVAGSTWPKDIEMLSKFDFKKHNFKLIIAPHEIDETNIQSVIAAFKQLKVVRFSNNKTSDVANADVLVIDNIGMLSSLYQYGRIAYVGGGFGKGIHNILEAATFGVPVVFGSRYQKFNEATTLIKKGGAFSISSINEFEKVMSMLESNDSWHNASKASKTYVLSKVGATNKIFETIMK